MIYAEPEASFEAVASGFPTGLAGTIGVRILDNVGGTTTARTTAGITELIAGSGIYAVTLTAPATAAQYSIVWDDGSITAPSDVATEDLTVTAVAPPGAAPADSNLCTLADVRLELEHRGAYTGQDSKITELIPPASKQIMREYEQEFAPATAATTRRRRVLPGRKIRGAVAVDLAPYNLRAVDAVTLHPEAAVPDVLAATEYKLMPVEKHDGVYRYLLLDARLSYLSDTLETFGFALLDVEGDWGFASIPTEVRRACALTVAAWVQRTTAVGAGSVDDDEPRQILPDRPTNFSIPPAARRMLATWRRHSGMF